MGSILNWRPMKAYQVKRLVTTALGAVLAGSLAGAWAGSLFKYPVIAVSPRAINFGAVPLKSTVTNTFLVENWGGGKLVGTATVPRPFKILSGASYRLGPSDVQVVTISYTPSGAPLDTNVVKFTGASGTVAPVVGRRLSIEK
jgi:hypothetical protein